MHDPLFDPSEQRALANAEFFRLKSGIDAKINALFGQLKAEIDRELNSAVAQLPPGFPMRGGRIHRGENHGGFPWRAVDGPALFSKEEMLAFRCLLLWGHHFSFHLLLSGGWLRHCLDRLDGAWDGLVAARLQLALRSDPWKWEFSPESHRPLERSSAAELHAFAQENGFLKLSRLHPLAEASSLVPTGLATWRAIQQGFFI